MSPAAKIPILLVEDSEDDRFFFKRLLTKAGITVPVAIATDGQQAIDYLRNVIDGGAPNNQPECPRLIFLDLKLPLRGGFEVLQWIRAQPPLAKVVVVILSSSAESRDVVQAFAMGAQGYLVKYPEPRTFADVLERVSTASSNADVNSLTLPGLPRPPSAS
jgi:CheY-like chemotaxis protein